LNLIKKLRYIIIALGAWIISQAQHDSEVQKRGDDEGGQEEPVKVVAIVSFDDKTAQSNKIEADREYRTHNSLKNATWCAFIAAFIYAGIAAYQAYEMRRTTLAAQQSATAALAQLEATDRPWIEVVPKAGSPIDFAGDGTLNFHVTFDVTNVGHSVATNVAIIAALYIPPIDERTYFQSVERQKAVCNKGAPTLLTISVFPNETRRISVWFLISPEELQNNGMELPPNPLVPPGKRIKPNLVGCVDYRFASLPRRHQTGFFYTVTKDSQFPNFHNPIIVGQDVPTDQIYLERSDFGGDDAN